MRRETSAISSTASFLSGAAGRVIKTALMLLILIEGARLSFSFGHSIFYQEPMEEAPGTDVTVTLSDGADMEETAALLKEDGLIRDELPFIIQGTLYKVHLYPGTYTLNTSMTTKEMLQELNLSEEEYAARKKEEALSDNADESDVLGGGSDLVDEAQAAAAAKSGIEVEAENGRAESKPDSSAENGNGGSRENGGAEE